MGASFFAHDSEKLLLINHDNCNYHRACSHLTTRSYFLSCQKQLEKWGSPRGRGSCIVEGICFVVVVDQCWLAAVPDGVRRKR
jgi:hypothetical protein